MAAPIYSGIESIDTALSPATNIVGINTNQTSISNLSGNRRRFSGSTSNTNQNIILKIELKNFPVDLTDAIIFTVFQEFRSSEDFYFGIEDINGNQKKYNIFDFARASNFFTEFVFSLNAANPIDDSGFDSTSCKYFFIESDADLHAFTWYFIGYSNKLIVSATDENEPAILSGLFNHSYSFHNSSSELSPEIFLGAILREIFVQTYHNFQFGNNDATYIDIQSGGLVNSPTKPISGSVTEGSEFPDRTLIFNTTISQSISNFQVIQRSIQNNSTGKLTFSSMVGIELLSSDFGNADITASSFSNQSGTLLTTGVVSGNNYSQATSAFIFDGSEVESLRNLTFQSNSCTNGCIRITDDLDLSASGNGSLTFTGNNCPDFFIDVMSGTVTITLDESTTSDTTAGTAAGGITYALPTGSTATVTVEAPANAITLTGIPQVTNAIVAIENLSTQAVTYPAISNGSATAELEAGTNYRFIVDAPGYLRQTQTLSGSTASFEFSPTSFRSLYDTGTSRASDISFNYSTLAVTIGDGTANLSFADVFRTIEDYLATQQGILFDFPPVPVVVDTGDGVRNYLFFPYDTDQSQVNPVVIRPDPSNTTDPTLTDFVIVLEDATAPLFDIFDFSAAGGRTIRFQTDAVAATLEVSGSGALTTAQANQLAELHAALENSGVFSAAALANAPSSSGLDAAGVRAAIGLAAANLDTQLDDIPTVTEFEARTLPSADYSDATASNQSVINNLLSITQNTVGLNNTALTEIQGTGFDASTDSLPALRDRGDAAWITATGFSTHSAPTNFENLAIDGSGQVTAGNMRGTDGALLAASYTAPNNAAIAAIAIDTETTIPGLIAGLNDLDSAAVQSAAAAALTAYDGPTRSEATSDKAEILTAISNLPAPSTATLANQQAILSAATALADGRFAIDYENSIATQYNADGSSRTVFDLRQADGTTPATTAQDAVQRRPQ